MNSRMAVAVLAGAWILPVHAADLISNTTSQTGVGASTATNTMTIAASAPISPGRYTASISPSINSSMAARLEKVIGKIKGVSGVQARADDSSIHFAVKNGGNVRTADIQKAVADADSGAVMSMPILEHSLTTNPGL
jgi:hypothetical protein